MSTLSLEKYRKLIRDLIEKKPDLSQSDLLLELLKAYLGYNIGDFQIFSFTKHHLEDAKQIKNKIEDAIKTRKKFNLLESLNEIFGKKKVKQGSFYTLFLAYFTYFNNLYHFSEFPTLKIQFDKQAEIYKNQKNNERIDNVLKMIGNKNPHIAMHAIESLGGIDIPKDKKDLVIKCLLQVMKKGETKYSDEKGGLYVFHLPDKACRVLMKIGLSSEYQKQFINLLLNRINFDRGIKIEGNIPQFENKSVALFALDKIIIPPEFYEKVKKSLDIETIQLGSLKYIILKKVTNKNELTEIEDKISKKIFAILLSFDTDYIVSEEQVEQINCALSQVRYLKHIPKEVLNKMFDLIRLSPKIDYSMPYLGGICHWMYTVLTYLYQHAILTDDQKNSIIDVFIAAINSSESLAFSSLGSIALPSEKLSEVVDTLLDLIQKGKNYNGALELLSKINIPKEKSDIILTKLLNDIDLTNLSQDNKFISITLPRICRIISNIHFNNRKELENLIDKLLAKTYADRSGSWPMAMVIESLQKIPSSGYIQEQKLIKPEIRKQTFENLRNIVKRENYYFEYIASMNKDERKSFQDALFSKLSKEKDPREIISILKALLILETQKGVELSESMNVQIRLERMKEERCNKMAAPYLIKYIEKFKATNMAKIGLRKEFPIGVDELVLGFTSSR